jgi:two-component sensor histidine kinase
MNIYFNDAMRTIDDNDYFNVCKRFRNRIIAILYLKESLNKQEIKEYDITSYIQSLQSDLFGAYETFRESKFLSGMCELKALGIT